MMEYGSLLVDLNVVFIIVDGIDYIVLCSINELFYKYIVLIC